MYKVMRVFQNSDRKTTIRKGLTLEQAQTHCSDPENCSDTCKTEENKKITAEHGPWMDCYYEEVCK